jgi:hypothetical protein
LPAGGAFNHSLTEFNHRRAEISLDILKALGIILAGFLVAAINALVAK